MFVGTQQKASHADAKTEKTDKNGKVFSDLKTKKSGLLNFRQGRASLYELCLARDVLQFALNKKRRPEEAAAERHDSVSALFKDMDDLDHIVAQRIGRMDLDVLSGDSSGEGGLFHMLLIGLAQLQGHDLELLVG